MIKNLPNYLTFFRLLCIPLIVLFFYLPFSDAHWVAAGLFVVAAITDWLDGYLARLMHQDTRFGAFLDPVVDKVMVAVILVLVVGEQGSWVLVLPAAVIIAREIIISALREWMAELGKRSTVAVSSVAKVKTASQLFALALLLLYSPDQSQGSVLLLLGTICLYGAALLTLWSMGNYIKLAWTDLTSGQ